MYTLKRFFYLLLAIGIGILFSNLIRNGFNSFQNKPNKEINQETIESQLLELNKNLPQRVNKFTVFDSIQIIDNNIIYGYTIEGNNFNDTKNKKLSINQQIENLVSLCNKESLLPLFDMGYVLKHLYSDNTSTKIFETKVTKKDCSLLNAMNNLELANFLITQKKKALPIEIDKNTIASDIKKDGEIIILEFMLKNYLKEELNLNEITKLIETNSILKNCSSPFTLVFFNKGYSIKDIYLDKNRKPLVTFTTKKEMCNK